MASRRPEEIIEEFQLKPHPFDGWFAAVKSERKEPTRIHYLMRAGELAPWHRTDGQLMITHIDGAPFTISTSQDGHHMRNAVLGLEDNPARLIPAGIWRSWQSMGFWSLLLISSTEKSDFLNWELAPDDWQPHWP